MLAEHFVLIKNMHIGLVLLSGSLFVLRGLWVLLLGSGSALQKKVNRLSYVIDTCLLLAAVLLLVILEYAPLAAAWLQVKLILLVLYVVLGVFAFRNKYSMTVRWLAYVAALLCFALMYYSARLHQPLAGLLS
ncbi:SirB2 family protein [Pseudomonas sp. C27(2019)]|uniref:SirB2 family protein n=1 Tax=Pseudomonas sp. C27(2019) TaxID=2604941 RepID=UPI0015B6EC9A|nr:SirB2 family protein [Pseudomonas sp. C27(2019)]